jgi:hypothetical protein
MHFSKHIWSRVAGGIALFAVLLFGTATLLLILQQDRIVDKVLETFNGNFKGAIVIGDSDISPFANFPYVSIVLEDVQVYEDKADMFAPILDVTQVYLGFNIKAVLSGIFQVNLLRVNNGNFDIVRYSGGSLNLSNALSGKENVEKMRRDYNFELKRIELANLDIIHYDERTATHLEVYVQQAASGFKSTPGILEARLKSNLVLNLVRDGDSTILKRRHIAASTEIIYDKQAARLSIAPTLIRLNKGDINLQGTLGFAEGLDYDLELFGSYPNFDLLISFAPDQLVPALQEYENAGDIQFEATVVGQSTKDRAPAIYTEFRCDSAYFRNPASDKKLEQISFRGYFTNGADRNASTMEFVLENMSAKPESGTFMAGVRVANFEKPEIDMSVTSHFDLDFLAKFLNVKSVRELRGDVSLEMRFRDIIDLQNPERSLEEFSQSYYTQLEVEDLSFRLPGYPLLFDSIDIKATMEGNRAAIDYVYMNVGRSDITIRGEIDDLPAIVHQTADSVQADLFVFSSLLDIGQLQTGDTSSIAGGEKMHNMRLELAFRARADALTDFEYLPKGDFYIRNFFGKPEFYPHTFRQFDAHVVLGEEDLVIRQFTGSIDESTFVCDGLLYDYPVLLQDTVHGVLDMDFSLRSDRLRLHDLFSYKGKNYIPPDYRNEIIEDFVVYGNTQIYFEDSVQSVDVYFDQLSARAQVHEMPIRDIHGKVQLSQEALTLDQLAGRIGNTAVSANMHLYLGENDSVRAASNMFELQSPHFDFDELSNYASGEAGDAPESTDPDSLFNIYELPFTDMRFAFDMDTVRYHRHLITDLDAGLRMQKDHRLYVDTLRMYTAGGIVQIAGHFDGSDADSIYFYPNIRLQGVQLQELLYQFDNFGQDGIVSDNLRGRVSGVVGGAVRVYPNMVPDIEASDLTLDLVITDGEIRNYKPFLALDDYFKDKNLARVRFDTLSNRLYVQNGNLVLPRMTINSTLGYLDISGKQDMDLNMEYYFRIPFKMVSRAATHKLFGKKGNAMDSTQIDVIQHKSADKKIWYVNLKLEGTPDNYDVRLERKKEK